MHMFITEKVPRGLRGQLTRWMLELKPGVFVGTLSTLVGEKLWDVVNEKMKDGGAIWIRATNTEQKFEIKGCGEYKRYIRDFDGLQLITIPQETSDGSHSNDQILNESEHNNENINELPLDSPQNEEKNLPLDSKLLIYMIKDALEYVLGIIEGNISNPFINNDLQKKASPEFINNLTESTNNFITKSPIEEEKEYHSNIKYEQNQSEQSNRKIKDSSPEIPHPDWAYQEIPENFIIREVKFIFQNNSFCSEYNAKSSYWEYQPAKVWNPTWKDDLEKNSRIFLEYLSQFSREFLLSKIANPILAIDIETTNYIPKAFEGFINIIGLSRLIIPKDESLPINLFFFQNFNMTRKKNLGPNLVTQVAEYFLDVTDLVVFNQDFDIKILSRIIDDNKLNVKFPPNIIDMQNNYGNLRNLEVELEKKHLFYRKTTVKGEYDKYYSLFKGTGKLGMNKEIEPIGIYNLMDCLSPLVMYIESKLKMDNTTN